MIFDSDAGQQAWFADGGIAPFSAGAMSSTGSEFVASPTFEEPYWLFSAEGLSPETSSSTPPDNYNVDSFSLYGYGSGPSSPDHGPETPDHFATAGLGPLDMSSAALHKPLSTKLGDGPYIRSNSYNKMMDDGMIAPESAPPLPVDPTSRRKHEKARSNSASSESGSSRKSSTSTSASASKLRTASRKPKNRSSKTKSATSAKPPVSDQVLQARVSHNIVERQYRNRLNKQFEQLLAILPTTRGAEGDAEELCSGDESRRFSKAEVLIQARRRIQALDKENEILVMERDRLRIRLDLLQGN